MALDKKMFAIVARATNSLYFYVTADTLAAVKGGTYFNDAQVVGAIKAGDIILVNSTAGTGGGFGILRIKAVDVPGVKVTTEAVTLGASG